MIISCDEKIPKSAVIKDTEDELTKFDTESGRPTDSSWAIAEKN